MLRAEPLHIFNQQYFFLKGIFFVWGHDALFMPSVINGNSCWHFSVRSWKNLAANFWQTRPTEDKWYVAYLDIYQVLAYLQAYIEERRKSILEDFVNSWDQKMHTNYGYEFYTKLSQSFSTHKTLPILLCFYVTFVADPPRAKSNIRQTPRNPTIISRNLAYQKSRILGYQTSDWSK